MGAGVSTVGDMVALTALSLHLSASGYAPVIYLLLAPAVVLLALGKFAGFVVKRVGVARALYTICAAQVLLYGVLALDPPLPLLLATVSVDALLALMTYSAVSSLIPSLAPDNISKSYGLLQAATTVGRILGPVTGAVLYSAVGFSWSMLLNSGTFAVYTVVGVLVFRAVSLAAPELSARAGAASTAGPSYRSLLADPTAGRSIMILLTAILFVAIIDVSFVFFALNDLNAGHVGFGLLLTSLSVGFLIGTRIPIGDGRRNLHNWLLAGSIVFGGSLALQGLVLQMWWAASWALVAGISHSVQNRSATSLIGTSYSDEARPIAFSVFGSLTNVATVAGFLLAGPLLTTMGSRATLAFAGIAACASTIILHLAYEAKRNQGGTTN